MSLLLFFQLEDRANSLSARKVAWYSEIQKVVLSSRSFERRGSALNINTNVCQLSGTRPTISAVVYMM